MQDQTNQPKYADTDTKSQKNHTYKTFTDEVWVFGDIFTIFPKGKSNFTIFHNTIFYNNKNTPTTYRPQITPNQLKPTHSATILPPTSNANTKYQPNKRPPEFYF